MKKIAYILLFLFISLNINAGGNPEHVTFPEGYQTEFKNYDTRNRMNGKQVAVLYANEIAIRGGTQGKLADGAKIVMEIYKTIAGEDGKPTVDEKGNFNKGAFAAIAVMEKRANWSEEFDKNDRAGDWGFALYNTDGSIKENNLPCASCHTPMPEQDYLFSHDSLISFSQ